MPRRYRRRSTAEPSDRRHTGDSVAGTAVRLTRSRCIAGGRIFPRWFGQGTVVPPIGRDSPRPTSPAPDPVAPPLEDSQPEHRVERHRFNRANPAATSRPARSKTDGGPAAMCWTSIRAAQAGRFRGGPSAGAGAVGPRTVPVEGQQPAPGDSVFGPTPRSSAWPGVRTGMSKVGPGRHSPTEHTAGPRRGTRAAQRSPHGGRGGLRLAHRRYARYMTSLPSATTRPTVRSGRRLTAPSGTGWPAPPDWVSACVAAGTRWGQRAEQV